MSLSTKQQKSWGQENMLIYKQKCFKQELMVWLHAHGNSPFPKGNIQKVPVRTAWRNLCVWKPCIWGLYVLRVVDQPLATYCSIALWLHMHSCIINFNTTYNFKIMTIKSHPTGNDFLFLLKLGSFPLHLHSSTNYTIIKPKWHLDIVMFERSLENGFKLYWMWEMSSESRATLDIHVVDDYKLNCNRIWI